MKLTTDYSTLARIALAVGALSFLSSVEADFAVCLPGWEWSYNSEGQNPCEIAGSLQAPCLGYSVYELGPLANGTNYVTPQTNDTTAQKCGCNTIIYSLYAACTLCQRNSSAVAVTWQFWSQFCQNGVYVDQYPFDIPYNSSVPHWAYVNYTANAFDPTIAEAAGRDPEATPKTPSVISLPSSTGSTLVNTPTNKSPGTGTSSTPFSTSGGNNTGGSKNNTGAIAGGVVGGLAGLAALAALAFFFLKRRRANENTDDIMGPNPLGYNPATSEPRFEQPPKLYNPADPSTFPTPVSAGDSSYSGGQTTNPFQPGRYNGAPEL